MPKSQYHHGNLKQALMNAALLQIKENGVEKLSLRAVAKAVDVSQSAPYRHFKNKQSLLRTLAVEGFNKLTSVLKTSIADPALEPLRALQLCGISYIEFAIDNPEQFRLMFGSRLQQCESNDDCKQAAGHAYEVLNQVITRCVAEQLVLEPSIELGSLAAWAQVHGLALLIIDGALTTENDEQQRWIAEQVTGLFARQISKESDPQFPDLRTRKVPKESSH